MTRRTRKEKERALEKLHVKWQFENVSEAKNEVPRLEKSAIFSDNKTEFSNSKKDILKSLFIACLILVFEVVIYLSLERR